MDVLIPSSIGIVHSSEAGSNCKLYIITAVVSLYLPGCCYRFRSLSCYLLADSVYKIDCPEMLYLSLRTGNRAEYRCHQGNHDIIDAVLSNRTLRKVHSLRKPSLVHLSFAASDDSPVETLVQDQIESDVEETQCP